MNAIRNSLASEKIPLEFRLTIVELVGLPPKCEGQYFVEWKRGSKSSDMTKRMRADNKGRVYWDQQFPPFKASLFRKKENNFHVKKLKFYVFQELPGARKARRFVFVIGASWFRRSCTLYARSGSGFGKHMP